MFSVHPPDLVSQLLNWAAALVRPLQLGVAFWKRLLISAPGFVLLYSNPRGNFELLRVKS